MDIFINIIGLIGMSAAILFFVSALTPKTAFFLKNPTKAKAANAWFSIGLVCFAIFYMFMPDKETALPKGTPLAYLEVKKDETIKSCS